MNSLQYNCYPVTVLETDSERHKVDVKIGLKHWSWEKLIYRNILAIGTECAGLGERREKCRTPFLPDAVENASSGGAVAPSKHCPSPQ